MWCVACGRSSDELRRSCQESLCRACEITLRSAPDRVIADSRYTLLVRSRFHHDGAARRLVHLMKYQGSIKAAELLARRIAPLVDATERSLLVPIPRVWSRRWRYGVDQSGALARRAGHELSLPVIDLLVPPAWSGRHAGQRRDSRQGVAFRVRPAHDGSPRYPSIVLIDDVVTTGATLLSALEALDRSGYRQVCAVTATTSIEVTSLWGVTASKGRATWK